MDATGGTTGVSDYDAWGNVRTATSGQGLFGWTGEPRDAVTGLTYLRARDYSPGTGRFVQRDTVSPNGPGTQSFNPYAYVAGNPTTFTDPSGHYPSAEVIVHIVIAFDFTALSALSASYGIQFLIVESAIAGAAVTPAGPNYWAAFVLFTVAALMFAFALMVQQIAYCLHYGVVCGGTVDVSGLAQILSGTTGQASLAGNAARTRTCEVGLGHRDSYGFILEIIAKCPDRPGGNCELEAGADFAYGMVGDAVSGGGMAGPYGAYFSAIGNGADALLSYYQCKKHGDSCPALAKLSTQILAALSGIDNIINNILDQKHLDWAAQEIANGGPYVDPDTGKRYDHAGEVRDGQRGLRNRIEDLEKRMNDSRISRCESDFLQGALDRARAALENSYKYVP